MERQRLVWMLTALLGSGQALAASDRLILDGYLCFIDSSGSVQNFVTFGEGPCAGTYGEVDVASGSGTLQVWDEVLSDDNMGAELTLFGEGTHSWTYVGSASDGSLATYTYTFTVGPGQVGGGMLFTWGNAGGRYPFGVVNVWDVSFGCANRPWAFACETYTSTDWDGDGQPGGRMQGGPFQGLNMSFDFYASPVPLPAAVWLFAGGLAGLAGAARWQGRA